MNILEKIISKKRSEIIRQKNAVPGEQLMGLIRDKKLPQVSFRQTLEDSGTGIIAEFKRRSPSKGWIFEQAEVEIIVPDYEAMGASAVSVLTDEPFFGGTISDLQKARNLVKLPLLRKDFIIDEYQLLQAKVFGANVVLLIASALTVKQTEKLAAAAKALGLEVLLEIHTESELEYLGDNIDVVGINNRNLSTFKTDIQVSFELGALIPDSFVKISESGISDPKVVMQLREAGFKGFLMGENFMKTEHPAKALREFIRELEGENEKISSEMHGK